jgi:hypothetical protein
MKLRQAILNHDSGTPVSFFAVVAGLCQIPTDGAASTLAKSGGVWGDDAETPRIARITLALRFERGERVLG